MTRYEVTLVDWVRCLQQAVLVSEVEEPCGGAHRGFLVRVLVEIVVKRIGRRFPVRIQNRIFEDLSDDDDTPCSNQ